jgi:hypothetical protein
MRATRGPTISLASPLSLNCWHNFPFGRFVVNLAAANLCSDLVVTPLTVLDLWAASPCPLASQLTQAPGLRLAFCSLLTGLASLASVASLLATLLIGQFSTYRTIGPNIYEDTKP